MPAPSPVVVVTGANGLVGSRVCSELVERGATVRAVVRRPGTAPQLDGVSEHVGEFYDPGLAAEVVAGAYAVVSTVHPMGSDRSVQQRVAVEGTPLLARAARDAGVRWFVHVSTAGVYDRSPAAGDVREDSPLVSDDDDDYSVTKRDTDLALAEVDQLTTVLVRPPAILGSSPTSVWNTLRPAAVRDGDRSVNPTKSFVWIHVDDLARFIAEVATGAVTTAEDPEQGPVPGAASVVLLAGEDATWREYHGTVTEALGVDPDWTDDPVWTGRLHTDRARRWGWVPRVDLTTALAELRRDLARPTNDGRRPT